MNAPVSTKACDRGSVSLRLREIVEEVAHLLPDQAPLHAFVHHNTLHQFEHLPFEQAVVEGGRVLGAEPFQTERAFAEHLASGRITGSDIDAVVAREEGASDADELSPLHELTHAEFCRGRLRHLFEIPRGTRLRWLVEETNLLRQVREDVSDTRRQEIKAMAGKTSFSSSRPAVGRLLESLWHTLLDAAATRPSSMSRAEPARRRDQLLAVTDVDIDETNHPLLIRLSAAYLDQGIAYWSMPGRERGLLAAFRHTYGQPFAWCERTLARLAETLAEQESAKFGAEDTIAWALGQLGHDESEWPAVIADTLMSLRGWAGMMHHLERRPDRAPVRDPQASLLDYLAVQLTLDAVAARHVLDERGVSCFQDLLRPSSAARQTTEDLDALVFEGFVVAQHLPVDLSGLLRADEARAWLRRVAQLHELERRRFLHLAYEHRHRVEVLDALAERRNTPARAFAGPRLQAVFCIDEREESLRRHLEERFPDTETFGYAGFFGVAMAYQGFDDVRSRPLCPVVVDPKHHIVELAVEPANAATYRARRRWQARVSHAMSVGSLTLTRGGLVTAAMGLLSTVPLVLRSLFPRLGARVAHAWDHSIAHRPETRLALVRAGDETGKPQLSGYSVAEMTDIVGNALRTMGMSSGFAPMVLIVGHGSSSLNNPHEAAHDCGATGGGRGGPNARAFAAMANHAGVRAQLAEHGLSIPEATWFLGAYHNTCDDSMTYYDESLVPASHREELAYCRAAFEVACLWDAHERCRRFETARLGISVDRALIDAQTHANDLAQPRPEYGHATNAVCLVGRRSSSRGVFFDRRAFLVSYDPTQDPSGDVLTSLLLSVGPVGAGINLEYYFSFIDPQRYGSGTKLPHNITGLVGVMDGHASDLRTGLPWQMVEIHEPVRLLTVIEAEPSRLESIVGSNPGLARLVVNGWIQVIAWSPSSGELFEFRRGAFHRYEPGSAAVVRVQDSPQHYQGSRQHLVPALVDSSELGATS